MSKDIIQEFDEKYAAYYQAELIMRSVLHSSGLSSPQIVVLSQLAGAIVDGRIEKKKSANLVVGKILDKCRELGISEDLIQQFQTFGNTWADKLYPHE